MTRSQLTAGGTVCCIQGAVWCRRGGTQWILQVGRGKLDPRDVAEAWVTANMDTTNKWIE